MLPSFKQALLNFLIEEWKKSKYVKLLRGYILYLGVDKITLIYETAGDRVTQIDVPSLNCEQGSDTRLIGLPL